MLGKNSILKITKKFYCSAYNLNAPHKGGRLLEEILKLFVNYSLKQDKNFFNNEKLKLITF